jgi:hypothetical protein
VQPVLCHGRSGITPSRSSSRSLASSLRIQGSYRGSLPTAVARMQSMRRDLALAIHPRLCPCAHVRRGTKESSGSLALPHRHQACRCSTKLAQSNTFLQWLGELGATVEPTWEVVSTIRGIPGGGPGRSTTQWNLESTIPQNSPTPVVQGLFVFLPKLSHHGTRQSPSLWQNPRGGRERRGLVQSIRGRVIPACVVAKQVTNCCSFV